MLHANCCTTKNARVKLQDYLYISITVTRRYLVYIDESYIL